MPLSKEAQRAWQEKPPRRGVHHDTVEPMTRFGRKWLWDLTLNVPVHLLGEALETPAPPPDATTPPINNLRDRPQAAAGSAAPALNLDTMRTNCPEKTSATFANSPKSG